MKSLWENVKSVFKWVTSKLTVPGVAILAGLTALFFLVLAYAKNMGGAISALLFGGSKKGPNTVASKRVDKNGVPIPPGTPDSKGMAQAVTTPLDDGGLFSNPDTVTVADQKVDLPDGVKAKDVDTVVVAKPQIDSTTVNDNSGVTKDQVDDLLAKYGKK